MIRWIVLTLAVLRATRFVTTDKLGEWTVSGPLIRWAWLKEGGHLPPEDRQVIERWRAGMEPLPMPEPDRGWRSKLVNGLDCPFCLGFWVAALGVTLELAIPHSPRSLPGSALRSAWKVGKAAFALNYVTGHVSKRLDGSH
ncbi:hypothetical protein HOT31_gp034 [Microbacterium phage Hendrix]|uniref:DUF1360 domain-containing protein n=1 Tax=Microbacterium phage Hendrix TaxID=2182341 RepID=A0A2U8UU41_9CAUD|nr:hypothetical protein HOT31_gp034 [Microbacterium phage Hendrix]AWN07705.1 hypothetical protein PBI_HENDRIX_34 [Microbacterium phage Hendrix]